MRDRRRLTEGVRVCSYWSQQYRCLYPGKIESTADNDGEEDDKLIDVEFDDGDNHSVPLEDIRLLPQDYPLQGNKISRKVGLLYSITIKKQIYYVLCLVFLALNVFVLFESYKILSPNEDLSCNNLTCNSELSTKAIGIIFKLPTQQVPVLRPQPMFCSLE